MSKAMLIMDMPSRCLDCKLAEFHLDHIKCYVNGMTTIEITKKPSCCPLRKVPEKQNLDIQTCSALSFSEEEIDMARGYNACVDKILGN